MSLFIGLHLLSAIIDSDLHSFLSVFGLDLVCVRLEFEFMLGLDSYSLLLRMIIIIVYREIMKFCCLLSAFASILTTDYSTPDA